MILLPIDEKNAIENLIMSIFLAISVDSINLSMKSWMKYITIHVYLSIFSIGIATSFTSEIHGEICPNWTNNRINHRKSRIS